LCSRETATLLEWMTCASVPFPVSQKPSRPASKATAMQVLLSPFRTALIEQERNRYPMLGMEWSRRPGRQEARSSDNLFTSRFWTVSRNGGRPFKMTAAKLRLAQAPIGKPGTKIGELAVSRQTLYRHMDPEGQLRPDGKKLLGRKRRGALSVTKPPQPSA
jgi:hypothetical protein